MYNVSTFEYTIVMAYEMHFNEEKSQLLRATKGIGFEDVIVAIKNKKLLADIDHPSSKRSDQKVYVVQIDNYAYVIPYVVNESKNEIFFKTIYPSRVFTKKYVKKGKDDETKK
jgi:hypothetical protein